jgi:hypothetical protein
MRGQFHHGAQALAAAAHNIDAQVHHRGTLRHLAWFFFDSCQVPSSGSEQTFPLIPYQPAQLAHPLLCF